MEKKHKPVVMTGFRVHLALSIIVVMTMACSTFSLVGSGVPSIVVTPTQTSTQARERTVMTTPTPIQVSVTAARSLNVRAQAGHDKRVIGALYHGNSVVMTGVCDDGWAQIVWQDGTAWVNASYLSENKCSENDQ